jgi:hypothetical protein
MSEGQIAKELEARGEQLGCPSSIAKDRVAFAIAHRHIHAHQLLNKMLSFTSEKPNWRSQPLALRGLSLQFFADFHTCFDIPESFNFLTVLWIVQMLTKVSQLSIVEMMGGKLDKFGIPYCSKVSRFVSHATAHTSFLDYEALLAYEKKQSQAAAETLYFFIDVFSINQNDVAGEGELRELESLIREAKTTVLIFNRWHNPDVIRRIWCVFEIEKTIKHGCVLDVCFSAEERSDFFLALEDNHPEGFGPNKVLEAVGSIDARKAEATQPADKENISKDIENSVEGGFEALNAKIMDGLRAALGAEVLAHVQGLGGEGGLGVAQRSVGMGKFLVDTGKFNDGIELLEGIPKSAEMAFALRARLYFTQGYAYNKREGAKRKGWSYDNNMKARAYFQAAVFAWQEAPQQESTQLASLAESLCGVASACINGAQNIRPPDLAISSELLDEAEENCKQAVAIYSSLNHPKHPTAVSDMGSVWCVRSKLCASSQGLDNGTHYREEAIRIYEQQIADGSILPDLAGYSNTCYNLGKFFADSGRHGNAVPPLLSSLKVRIGLLGFEHPRTQMCRNQLASTFDALGDASAVRGLREGGAVQLLAFIARYQDGEGKAKGERLHRVMYAHGLAPAAGSSAPSSKTTQPEMMKSAPNGARALEDAQCPV